MAGGRWGVGMQGRDGGWSSARAPACSPPDFCHHRTQEHLTEHLLGILHPSVSLLQALTQLP